MRMLVSIIVLLLCAAPACAETLVLSFTDSVNCRYCRAMKPIWDRPAVVNVLGDTPHRTVDFSDPKIAPHAGSLQAKYKITTIPATLIFEVGGDEPKLLRRADRAMDEPQLIRFLRGDQ